MHHIGLVLACAVVAFPPVMALLAVAEYALSR